MSNSDTVEVAVPPFLDEVIAGLDHSPPQLPPKLFYDAKGSRLFDEITELPEYYLTRTERVILRKNVKEIAEAIGSNAALIEFGSGSSDKTQILLSGLPSLTAYVPIDISGKHLEQTTRRLRERFNGFEILPVIADYSDDVDLPPLPKRTKTKVVFFPGSTIGNFHPDEAISFLRGMAHIAGPDCGILLGLDLVKDEQTLLHAYNDLSGVTAAFNLNILVRLNREAGANFELENWEHRAVWNAEKSRIEMHLLSTTNQQVTIGHHSWDFETGDFIHTENSYKFTPEALNTLVQRAGLRIQHRWTDEKEWFAVAYICR